MGILSKTYLLEEPPGAAHRALASLAPVTRARSGGGDEDSPG